MLLTEMVRLLNKEASLINDAASYSRAVATWGTVKDYGNVVLSEAGLLIFSYRDTGSPNASGVGLRLKIGTLYVHGITKTVSNQYDVNGIVAFPAGTFGVLMEGVGDVGFPASLDTFKLGFVKFNDLVQTNHALNPAYPVNNSVASRVLAPGTLKEAALIVTVFAETGTTNFTEFENVGDNFVNGVRIKIDGVQKSWNQRIQDNVNASGRRGAAYAIYTQSVNIGTTVGVTLEVDNVATNLSVSVILCPWILTVATQRPLTLSFPSGSTYYSRMEPLNGNPSKTSKIGKARAISYGVDDYSTATGVGILDHTYTLEREDPPNVDYSVVGGAIVDDTSTKQYRLTSITHVSLDVR